jgi:glucan phosphoethanolaminetransferase (alkaline phosphatase superfamily)
MLMNSSSSGGQVSEPSIERPERRGPLGWVAATTRQLIGFCRREKAWLAWTAVFVLVWTTELYQVQAVTLVYPNDGGPRFEFWAPKVRLVLDTLFILTLTVSLRRRWLVPLLVGAFFVYLGLVTYYQYFYRPVSILTIFNNWREGLQLGGFALDLFPKRATALLLLALAAKLAALYLSRRATLPRNCAWLLAAVFVAVYASLYLVANRFDPLDAIQTTRGVGRLGAIRGYTGPWLAEWYYLGDQQVLERALNRRSARYDRLTPVEAEIPIHDHLVILQAESLDYNILGFEVDGIEVTPFLNHLRQESMYYRVRAIHYNGSSDADFVALNGVVSSSHQNTYVIPGYPYTDTTPQLLARCGFDTYSFHGNSGEFYRRRQAFEKMGFKKIYFRKEFEERFGLPADHWGVPDKEVLTLSILKMREATTPTCHFIITNTTHTPYTMLPGEKEIFKNPRTTVQNYINNMRYLDNCLRDYVTSLGHGATIVIYGDHTTEGGEGDFQPDRDRSRDREYVPFYIYDTDQDLSKLQKTRNQVVAKDGSLNLVDMIKYVRGQVARACLPSPSPAAGHEADVPEVAPAAIDHSPVRSGQPE